MRLGRESFALPVEPLVRCRGRAGLDRRTMLANIYNWFTVGHSSITVTMNVYGHVMPAMMRRLLTRWTAS
jgi:integrase